MKKAKLLAFVSALLVGGLVLTYSNHFHNGFHFDDSHSLVNNIYIRDLKNIPLFFKDGATLSSLPANQAYRPLMPFFYAIDYAIGNGLNDTFQYHLTTFLFYLVQCILLFFLFKKIFDLTKVSAWNDWLALFGAAWYGYHTANAETINYISARSDSISTFFVVLGLVIYLYSSRGKRWGLYVIPAVLGILVKPAALVFPGLLFFYILFFDDKATKKGSIVSSSISALKYSLPAMIICAGLYLFQGKMTPATFIPGGMRFPYLITQPYVALHYFKNFFFPNDLSADTDWITIDSMANPKFMIGMLFILAMCVVAFFAWKKKEFRPLSYGIIWFFVALLPSSSIIPFAEVMNDHRTFFPYIGLAFGITWCIGLPLQKLMGEILTSPQKLILSISALVILSAHAYGTRVRNAVWKDDHTLWADVTVKSPKNGRGHLNYGLDFMNKGDYASAEKEYTEGLKYWPYYSYLHIDMAILKAAQNKFPEAEQYFQNGLKYGAENPEAYYYYADFLYKRGRKADAQPLLEKCLQLSPAHVFARYLLMAIYADTYQWDALQKLATETLTLLPGDGTVQNYLDASRTRKTRLDMAKDIAAKTPTPENYLSLSLEYYNVAQFEECIKAAGEALKLRANYPEAWNNICSAYNQLGRFEEAEIACNQALNLSPDYDLAHNNLNSVTARRTVIDAAIAKVKKQTTPENYLELSLVYYNSALYEKCIEACKEALKLNHGFAPAWNNICSAYNQMKNWDEAIKAGQEALKLDPNFELAKGNLNFAIQQKALTVK